MLLYFLLTFLLKKKKKDSETQVLARAYDFLDNYFFCKWMGNILTIICALRIISFLNYSFDKIGRKGADRSPKADAGSIDGRNLSRELVFFFT